MKNSFKTITIAMASAALLFNANISNAQNNKLAVMPMDSKGIVLDPEQLGNLLRIEVEKTDMYKVLDSYDIKSVTDQKALKINECYSKTCLLEVGKALNSDKVLSGSVERYGEKIIITLKLINVSTASVEKTQVDEYLNLQPEIQSMISVSLKNMLGIKNDDILVKRITKVNTYESNVNNPGVKQLSLSGPRMGVTMVTGKTAARISDTKANGGLDAYPVMTQFGYQFETQYLNSGNLQALVEFLPMITGIDQSLFIPNFTILNGFRNNKTGWEIAFGPSFGLARIASGYYEGGNWHLEEDWAKTHTEANTNPIVDQLDRRGSLKFNTGFVFAVGKTYKSGELNIPINMYVSVPDKDSWRLGISLGFNTKK